MSQVISRIEIKLYVRRRLQKKKKKKKKTGILQCNYNNKQIDNLCTTFVLIAFLGEVSISTKKKKKFEFQITNNK